MEINKLKLLVCCEESQTVCQAFRELGWEAYSCDIDEFLLFLQISFKCYNNPIIKQRETVLDNKHIHTCIRRRLL